MRLVYSDPLEDDRPQCVAQYPGCLRVAGAIIPCPTEGVPAKVCSVCLEEWRSLARAGTVLAVRCPRCADHNFKTGGAAPAVARPLPLEGAAAAAVEEALRMEGITADVRNRVLVRLRLEAPWLSTSYLNDSAEVAADEAFLRERAPA